MPKEVENKPQNLRLLMTGDSGIIYNKNKLKIGVGKSSLVIRFTSQSFTPSLVNTIGVDYKTKYININEKQYHVQVFFYIQNIDMGYSRTRTF